MKKFIYFVVAGLVIIVLGVFVSNTLAKDERGNSIAKPDSHIKKSDRIGKASSNAASVSDVNKDEDSSDVVETSSSDVGTNELELTEQSAIELYKKMYTVNPTLAEDIVWENYRDNAWRVETQEPGKIVLHYTNIGSGGSYYQFENLPDNRVKVMFFGGNATYPDNPTKAYVIDAESGKLLGVGAN